MEHNKKNNVVYLFGKPPAEAKESVEDVLADFLKDIEDAPDAPAIKHTKRTSQKIIGNNNTQARDDASLQQSIKGNGNVQLSGAGARVVIKSSKSAKAVISAPPGSIGANLILKKQIISLIKEIEDYRRKRLGSRFRHGIVYGELAHAFGLKKGEYSQIYLWDEYRADEVIEWLRGRLNNTQQGRIDKAAKNEGYVHSRGHLFSLEKDFVTQLGWQLETVKNVMLRVTGKVSRIDMSDNEFRDWVAYLRSELEKMYDETDY